MASGNAKLSGHAKTLLGPRTHGSVTKIGLFEFGIPDYHDFKLEAENGTVLAGCEAYTTHLSLDSTVGAVPISNISPEDLLNVTVFMVESCFCLTNVTSMKLRLLL